MTTKQFIDGRVAAGRGLEPVLGTITGRLPELAGADYAATEARILAHYGQDAYAKWLRGSWKGPTRKQRRLAAQRDRQRERNRKAGIPWYRC
jgi:hypothetical protein